MQFARHTRALYHWDRWGSFQPLSLIWCLSSIWFCWRDPFSEHFLSKAHGQHTLWEPLFFVGSFQWTEWSWFANFSAVISSPYHTGSTFIYKVIVHLSVAPVSSLDFALSPILASLTHITRQLLLMWQQRMCWQWWLRRSHGMDLFSTTISIG